MYKETDEWWRSKLLIDAFNSTCKNISDSSLKVGDESISEILFSDDGKRELTSLVLNCPQNRATGERVQDNCIICYWGLAIH